MNVTIVFDDSTMLIDGEARQFALVPADPNWRVIQWRGNKGWIEVHSGDRIWLDSIDLVQPYIDLYQSQPLPEDPPPESLVPGSVTRRQCALQLMAMGMISMAEAKAMAKNGTMPAFVAAYLDAAVANGAMTEEQRNLAEIDFAAVNYFRDNPLISMLMSANGASSGDLDQFFIAAARL